MTDSLQIDSISYVFNTSIRTSYEPVCGFNCSKCSYEINRDEPYCPHMKYIRDYTPTYEDNKRIFTIQGAPGPYRDLTITEFEWLFYKLGLIKRLTGSINIYQIVTCTILINRRTGTIELKVKLKEDIPLTLELTYNNNKIDIELLLRKVDTKRNGYLKANTRYEIDIDLNQTTNYSKAGWDAILSTGKFNFTVQDVKKLIYFLRKGSVAVEFKEPIDIKLIQDWFELQDEGKVIGRGKLVENEMPRIKEYYYNPKYALRVPNEENKIQYEIDIELKELLLHKPIMAPGYECYLSSCGGPIANYFFPRRVDFTIKKILSPDKRFLKSNEKGRVLIEFKEPFNLESSLTGFAIFDDGILIGSGRVVEEFKPNLPEYEMDIEIADKLPIGMLHPGCCFFLQSSKLIFTIKKINDREYLKENDKARVVVVFHSLFDIKDIQSWGVFTDWKQPIGRCKLVQIEAIATLEPSPLNIKIYQEEKGKYKDELVCKYTVRSHEEALKIDKEYHIQAGRTDPSTASLNIFEGPELKYSNEDVSLEQFLDLQSYLNLNERIIVSSLVGARARLNVRSRTFCIDFGGDTIRTFFLSSDFKLDYEKLPVRA